ncbi:hypothetical protein BXY51_008766 [Actinoplanes cyaneus]|nr:hypothetical protein [Actinoplanes cyaneus]
MSYPEPVREPAAAQFAKDTATPPCLSGPSIEHGHRIAGDAPLSAATVEGLDVSGGVPIRRVVRGRSRPPAHPRHFVSRRR